MIKYALKLWSNNVAWFPEAKELHQDGLFDAIEIYHNPAQPVDYEAMKIFSGIPVNIHNTHTDTFHTFTIGEVELAIWEGTKKLADFFESKYIIVHTGKNHNFESFKKELEKIDDPRILLENMPSLDIFSEEMAFHTIEDVKKIASLKSICFDFEKAFKSSLFQKIDYKEYVAEFVNAVKPVYFHISAGTTKIPTDEHGNVWEADFDMKWTKDFLSDYCKDDDRIVVFETPKDKDGLANDVKNINYFKNL